MKERLSDRIKRKSREKYDKFLKWVIRKAVQKHDDLNYGAFMAYCWERDEVTGYSVLAERSYQELHIYGTRVERLIDGEWMADK